MLPDGPVVVIGQVGRDVVVHVDELPAAGASAAVTSWWEGLGGKGANQAVGLSQLGASVTLVGVVGGGEAGRCVLEQAERDGIDVSQVARDGSTAALLDVVDRHGVRRLFEHVPDDALVRHAHIEAAADLLRGAGVVVLQLQQPADVLLCAARLARESGAGIVLEGGVEGAACEELLSLAQVIRADAAEAAMLTGQRLDDEHDAYVAAGDLLDVGPEVIALAVNNGDVVAWPGGQAFFLHSDDPVVDPTGAGDAFVAGLVSGLRGRQDRGSEDIEAAGRLAAAAARGTVSRLGGRPDLPGLA